MANDCRVAYPKKSEEVPTTNLKPIQFKNQPQICINEIIGIKVGPSEFYMLMVESYQCFWNIVDLNDEEKKKSFIYVNSENVALYSSTLVIEKILKQVEYESARRKKTR